MIAVSARADGNHALVAAGADRVCAKTDFARIRGLLDEVAGRAPLAAAPVTPTVALQLLAALGASPWLVRHHELVLEAATLLCDRLRRELRLAFDGDEVLVGAAIHDAGKILHPEEMREPGSHHETAGERLLIGHGVPASIARFCVTHASWDQPDIAIEGLLVALADKIWKGKRDDVLERRVAEVISRALKLEAWDAFRALDEICEDIAAEGPARLARSAV